MEQDKTTKSLVIPTYTISDYLEKLALECIESHRGRVDEIIVTEDGGKFSKKLKESADIYIYGKDNVGFTKNLNRGWRMATKDYVILANSDTKLISGNLKDLCIPLMVTSPKITKGGFGSYFVVSRLAQEYYGMLDETMKMFYSDIEFLYRVKDHYHQDDRVVVEHVRSSSTKKLNDKKEVAELDRQAYEKNKIR